MGLATISKERKRLQMIFIFPLVVSLIIMIIIPMVSLIAFSFTSIKVGFKDFTFVGLENYMSLVTDTNFINAFVNACIMLIGTLTLQMFLGIIYALIIHRTQFLNGFIRVVMMLPMVISPVIAGLIWRIILMPKYGGINVFLSGLGIINPPEWLSNPTTAKVAIIVAATWEWTPFVILFILAGLEGLPAAPFESIKIDGANWFQEIIHLTLPMMRNIIYVVVIFRIIEGLKVFPLVFAMTQGGPGRATEELTYFVYKNGFSYLKLGYAAASSIFIFLIIAIAIIFSNKIQNNRD